MKNLNDVNGDEFINSLENKELIIYEDVQGSKLYVQYNGDRFIIKPRSFKNDELNFIDLAIQKYYNKIFFFLHSLPSYITDIINKNWWFCFEYLPDTKPANIEYNRVPLNNLILTSIVKNGKHKFNYDEIVEYSNLFNVDPIPLIFKGKLTGKQIEVIRLFIKTKEEDLKLVFGEENFAKFFYTILNANMTNSFLMKDDKFNTNLEKIIIRISDNDQYTFEILNPLYKKNSDSNYSEYSQVYSLIIINFLEFLQLKSISTYKPKGLTFDEMYINLISIIFNDYMSNIKNDILKWDIVIPDFMNTESNFRLNVNLIRNKETKNYILSNEKIEYVFKIILSSFNKLRKKPLGLMTIKTVELLNETVNDIRKHIEHCLTIDRDYRFQKIDLLNFGEYFKIPQEHDGGGDIYPNMRPNFDKEVTSVDNISKKKKESSKGTSSKSTNPKTTKIK